MMSRAQSVIGASTGSVNWGRVGERSVGRFQATARNDVVYAAHTSRSLPMPALAPRGRGGRS